MFRIYRDTRFSHDKTPYKTHFGAFITPGGKNMLNAGYYIHFDAAEAFLAAGIHTPPANILQQIRHSIDINSKEFENIVQNSDLVNRYKMTSESLRSAPKGFSNDHPMINYLKLKSHTISFYPEIDIFLDDVITSYSIHYTKLYENISPDMMSKIDYEVKKFISEGLDRAEILLKKHRKKLDKVANELLKRETIEMEEFEKLMGGKKEKAET